LQNRLGRHRLGQILKPIEVFINIDSLAFAMTAQGGSSMLEETYLMC